MSCGMKIAFGLVVSLGLLAPGPLSAGEPDDRSGFSGKQLFEHDWKWTGPAQVPQNQAATRASQLAQARLVQQGLRSTTSFPKSDSGDGLGPLHNATSCAACHVSGGGSGVEHNVTLITIDPRSDVINQQRSGARVLKELFPGVMGIGGGLIFNTVVHDRSTRDGYGVIRDRLAEFVPDGIPDEWFRPNRRSIEAIAAQPVFAGRHNSVDFYLSQRNSPSLFGLGTIDRINPERLRDLARRQTRATEGKITGRFVGKFGWRGQVQTLREFVTGACAGELGLNLSSVVGSGVQADDPADPKYVNMHPDMKPSEFGKLLEYVSELPRPVERPAEGTRHGEVVDGETIFNSLGCSTCHMADVRPISGIFSDLLVHDMGPDLQAPSPAPIGDLKGVAKLPLPSFVARSPRRAVSTGAGYYAQPNPELPAPYPLSSPPRPTFPRGEIPELVHQGVTEYVWTWDTLQREWRTPPLWGVADSAPYLHDGRAATLEEAILWHGGEGKESRDGFASLTRTDKDLVVTFLSSLRAPVETAAQK